MDITESSNQPGEASIESHDKINERINKSFDVDQMLDLVGPFGRFQKIVLVMLISCAIPAYYPLFLTTFATISPTWKCARNGTHCYFTNKTFSSSDNKRCNMPREDWEYTTARHYSIVTEFDLVCKKEHLVELTTSMTFFGFMFGALALGRCADKFGRKKVLFISLGIVLGSNFISIFLLNIYVFIAVRFIVGFFMHGTYPQVYLLGSEVIGDEKRPLCLTFMVLIGPWISMSFQCLLAYLITEWKFFFLVCSLPYFYVFLFIKFVPESVRYHRVKGEIKEAMKTFERIAYWNNRKLPPNVVLAQVSSDEIGKPVSSGVLELFKSMKMASITLIMGFTSFAISITNYSLLLEAGSMTGHMYRDFFLVNFTNIPSVLIAPRLMNRIGRKKTTMLIGFLAGISCIALGFSQNNGQLRALRLTLGIFGTMCMCGGAVSYRTWAVELFPTHVRGIGMGLSQFSNKIGATCVPWIVTDMAKVHSGSAYWLIGSINFIALCLQSMLWETKGAKTLDVAEERIDDKGTVMKNVIQKDCLDERHVSYPNMAFTKENITTNVENC